MLLLGLLAFAGNLQAGVRAEGDDGISLDSLRNPAGSGWVPVAKGLWQRSTPDGRMETFAQGREGLESVLPALRTHLAELAKAYVEWPDDERRVALEEYTNFLKKIEAAVAARDRAAAPRGAQTKTNCQYNFSYGADAFPTQCTNNAKANASYSATGTNCESCDVSAYAYVERTCRGTTTTRSQSCFNSGTSVSCSVSASLTGAANSCFGYGFASIYCAALNNLYLSTSDTDSSCGTGICLACAIVVEDQ
jgi:hypothetical protein